MGLLVLFSFIVGSNKRYLRRLWAQSWDSWIYFGLFAVGLVYTSDLNMGLRVLETNLSLIAMPIVFTRIYPFTSKDMKFLCNAFCVGLMVALVYSLMVSASYYAATGDWREFLGDRFTSHLDNTHPVYFAYYIIFAITYGLYNVYYGELKLSLNGLSVFVIFMFFMILLTGSGTAVIGLLFCLLYFVLKFVFEESRDIGKTTAFLISIVLLSGLLMASYNEMLGFGYEDYWERFVLWKSAVYALPDWIFGVGTGDYISVLNQYYTTHDLGFFAASNYNPHNQFIEVLFSVGVSGLLALSVMLVRPIYLAVRTQTILGFLSLFPFLAYGITEVFLGRFQGVVFFALLQQIFISEALTTRNTSKSVLMTQNQM
ncbi:MAG: O-antigen ligase family protein [Bacteroidetes bacterium]|nr:O-antigen ligase family protein [Bacteroidota bacterium]